MRNGGGEYVDRVTHAGAWCWRSAAVIDYCYWSLQAAIDFA